MQDQHPALDSLRQSSLVETIARIAANIPCHVVGGSIRDLLLGRDHRDLDLVVERNGEEIADRLATTCSLRLIKLGGQAFASYRLVRDDLVIDLWDRQGASLTSDLERRDFTVNAIAMDVQSGALVDSVGGLDDLDRRCLRACTPVTFTSDPLRTVRLARLYAELSGFDIEGETLGLARQSAPHIVQVAVERIREELRLAIASPQNSRALQALADIHLYPHLWTGGRSPDNRRCTAVEYLQSFRGYTQRLEQLTAPDPMPLDWDSGSWSLVFAGLADRDPVAMLRRFSEQGYITQPNARRVHTLLDHRNWPVDEPARRWFLHTTGDLWPAAVCVLGVIGDGNRLTWEEAATSLKDLAKEHGSEIFHPQPLLNGTEVADLLAIEPGPGLGSVLAELRRAQIEGEVRTPSEAADFVLRMPRLP